ncbi:hypothetical protein [Mycolicibacterium poriferae]|uniref:hypothetical protein n=1 Tax=Mycolicibacterium poriferae TaxID=39694 RepID=UPI0024B920DB|nr:hypothetical protein [Mycolicibacterium poriferae]
MNPAETLACIAATRDMARALRTAERGWDWTPDGRRVAGDRSDAALRAAQLGQRLMALSGRRSYDPARVRPVGLADHGRFVASHRIGAVPSAN